MATMITFRHGNGGCGAEVQRSSVDIQHDGWPTCCGVELVKSHHIARIHGFDPAPEAVA